MYTNIHLGQSEPHCFQLSRIIKLSSSVDEVNCPVHEGTVKLLDLVS